MAEPTTIARPYAEAVYQMAKGENAFAAWTEMLRYAAAAASDPQLADWIGNPKLTRQQLEELFLSICDGQLTDQGKNLIRLLIANGRLTLLPHIQAAYERLRAEQEGVKQARIASAVPLEAAQLDDLVRRLSARFNCRIEPEVAVDPDLIGGVKVEVGDEVFDASVRGRLRAMASTLKH